VIHGGRWFFDEVVSAGLGLNLRDRFTLLTIDLRRPLTCWLLGMLPLSPLIRFRMRAAVIIPPLALVI
jgi:hypothetical protein